MIYVQLCPRSFVSTTRPLRIFVLWLSDVRLGFSLNEKQINSLKYAYIFIWYTLNWNICINSTCRHSFFSSCLSFCHLAFKLFSNVVQMFAQLTQKLKCACMYIYTKTYMCMTFATWVCMVYFLFPQLFIISLRSARVCCSHFRHFPLGQNAQQLCLFEIGKSLDFPLKYIRKVQLVFFIIIRLMQRQRRRVNV